MLNLYRKALKYHKVPQDYKINIMYYNTAIQKGIKWVLRIIIESLYQVLLPKRVLETKLRKYADINVADLCKSGFRMGYSIQYHIFTC